MGDRLEVWGVGVEEEGKEEVLEDPRAVHAQQHCQGDDEDLSPAEFLADAAEDVVEDEVV